MAETRFALAGTTPRSAPLRAAAQVVRVVPWAAAAVCAVAAFQTGGPARWVLAAAAAVAAAVAAAYRRFLADYARSSTLPTEGSLEVTADHLIVRHAGVLATDIAIPWAVIRAVCIDDGTRDDALTGDRSSALPPCFAVPAPAPDDAGAGDEPASPVPLFGSSRRRQVACVPLLAAAPVVPNVAVLMEPPVEVPWRYPFIAGPLNPPWGTAWPVRPWPAPAPTPAFLVAVADLDALLESVAAHVPVRELDDGDGRYLEACGVLR